MFQSIGQKLGFDGDIEFKGEFKVFGVYSIIVMKGEGDYFEVENQFLKICIGDKILLCSVQLVEDILWQGKGLLYNQFQEVVKIFQDDIDIENLLFVWQVYRFEYWFVVGNVYLVQKIFQGLFEFDVIFNLGFVDYKFDFEDVIKEIKKVFGLFFECFKKVFDFKVLFDGGKYDDFGKSMFFNFIGGVGYFLGYQLIDCFYVDEYEEFNEGFWEEIVQVCVCK